jgi:hypothetical protein
VSFPGCATLDAKYLDLVTRVSSVECEASSRFEFEQSVGQAAPRAGVLLPDCYDSIECRLRGVKCGGDEPFRERRVH